MTSKKYFYYFSYAIIIIGLFVSGYLLFHHFAIVAGKPLESDLCSVIFNKGCAAAVYSSLAVLMKIPVGGWGIVYLLIIGCFILFSQIFFKNTTDEIIQAAFWVSLFSVFFSLFFVVIMILQPVLFCPFCTIFHVLNFVLFFLIKKLTGKSYLELFNALLKALGIVLLAKPVSPDFNKLKWLAFILPVILGLSVYQWALMQGQDIRIEKLASYDPLIELEKFESRKKWDIQISPSDPLLGSKDAPVSLIVFSDFQCSVCEMFATNFKYLLDYNKEKLNITFKYFPLGSDCNPIATNNMHPLGCQAAKAAEAAHRQGKFWEYHDSLFARGIKNNTKIFFDVAELIDLDMVKFKTDYESESIREKINIDIQEGLRLELDGTPTAFLNGRMVRKMSENNINFLTKFLAR